MSLSALSLGRPGRLAAAWSPQRGPWGWAVIYAVAMMWFVSRLPMTDLPQHAAQVRLLHDLVFGNPPWRDELRINLFTPYLIGYGLALPLSLLMPAGTALKLLLCGAFVAYVAAAVRLRRELGGEPRLDWLFIPGFFGFAWKWGFLTFLLAAPLGLLFILHARRHALRPGRGRAVALTLGGVGLFFSHGLVFAYAVLVGVLFALALGRTRVLREPLRLAPYLLLGALMLTYAVVNQRVEAATPDAMGLRWPPPWERLPQALYFSLGNQSDRRFLPLGAALLAVPWVMGLRLNRRPGAWVLPAVTAALWLFVPSNALKTAMLYERFGVFLPTVYALMFAAAQPAPDPDRARRLRAGLVLAGLCCAIFLAVQTQRLLGFARESADFERLMASLPPQQRVLNLVFDRRSPAAHNHQVYVHHAAWYQAEKGGLLDFSFAWFPPQIVRYRAERQPGVGPGFDFRPETFDWQRHRGPLYDYFVVRGPLPPGLLSGGPCRVETVARAGLWSLHARRECGRATPG